MSERKHMVGEDLNLNCRLRYKVCSASPLPNGFSLFTSVRFIVEGLYFVKQVKYPYIFRSGGR